MIGLVVLVPGAWALVAPTAPPPPTARFLPTPLPYELPAEFLDFDCPASGCAVEEEEEEEDGKMAAFITALYDEQDEDVVAEVEE